MLAWRLAGYKTTSLTEMLLGALFCSLLCCARRRMALMRAKSSRGVHGFGT